MIRLPRPLPSNRNAGHRRSKLEARYDGFFGGLDALSPPDAAYSDFLRTAQNSLDGYRVG